jgi:hypothetical protein
VAKNLDITNGHAARMRFSRFKQHMEGTPTGRRKPRADAQDRRKAKVEKRVKAEASSGGEGLVNPKQEPTENNSAVEGQMSLDQTYHAMSIKAEPHATMEPKIKTEHTSEDHENSFENSFTLQYLRDVQSHPDLRSGFGQ